ncbi:MAG: hypothetical protein HGA85_06045 [Nanoarchaeota archaeon]|nr:hypothetical protein [Nanoarchaeota archaeon]
MNGFAVTSLFLKNLLDTIGVDMHMHSTFSDGASSVTEILEKAKEGKFGISITDHNEIRGAIMAWDKDVFVVPGIEVKSKELIDILFYFNKIEDLISFYGKEIEPSKTHFFHTTRTSVPVAKLAELSKIYDCLAVVAHPFGYSVRSSLKDVYAINRSTLVKFDIYEAINGGNNRKLNQLALDEIEKEKKAYSGGSDAHSIYSVGNVRTYAKAESVKEFLDSIRKKENDVVGFEGRLGKFGEYGRFAANKIKGILNPR